IISPLWYRRLLTIKKLFLFCFACCQQDIRLWQFCCSRNRVSLFAIPSSDLNSVDSTSRKLSESSTGCSWEDSFTSSSLTSDHRDSFLSSFSILTSKLSSFTPLFICTDRSTPTANTTYSELSINRSTTWGVRIIRSFSSGTTANMTHKDGAIFVVPSTELANFNCRYTTSALHPSPWKPITIIRLITGKFSDSINFLSIQQISAPESDNAGWEGRSSICTLIYDLSCSPSMLLLYTFTAVSDLIGSRLFNKFPCFTCSDTLTFSTNESITSSVGFSTLQAPTFL